jgi:heat shock protein HtpX
MTYLKRFFLFALTNILVVITISIICSVLGFDRSLRPGDYNNLLGFCFVWGMTGSFISLMMSRVMAKWMLGVKVIDPTNPGQYSSLLQMVDRLARAANLPNTPEVGVYESPEINAFATGPSKSRSLVAFSSGLLQKMGPEEIEGVTGHELGHIANGDMVTMTLLQGVINAFVMFISRILAMAITMRGDRDEDSRPSMSTYLLVPLFELLFGILGMIVVSWFSRKREFRADAASAAYGGRNKMIKALRALQSAHENPVLQPQTDNSAVACLKISGKTRFLSLFSTHPPLEERIAALESNR